jgi:hypothetical protein
MTAEWIIKFVLQRPFESFTIVLLDGRELHVRHPEAIVIGRFGLVVEYFHPTSQLEIVDAAGIISLRTIYPTNASNWEEKG